MKSTIKTLLPIIAIIVLGFGACRDKDNDPTPTANSGSVMMEFYNFAGADKLKMDGTWYKNAHGDSFQVTTFKYYITNISLSTTDGKTYTEADSYHLLDESKTGSLTFTLPNVPTGTYKSVSFMIGVDSARNTAGAQTGALDPANGMFWSWNTGYIQLKVEGKSPVSPAATKSFAHHIGGFAGADNTVRKVTLSLPTNLVMEGGKTKHIHLKTDLLKVYDDPYLIDFSVAYQIMMPGAMAVKMANNYVDMISVTNVE